MKVDNGTRLLFYVKYNFLVTYIFVEHLFVLINPA